MKKNYLFSVVFLILFIALPLFTDAQDRDNMSRSEIAKMDSVEVSTQQAAQLQKANDDNRMAEAKLDRKQTRAKLKDAQRVENDASNAARESRASVRSERKAQKARSKATKQAKRASDARDKSDRN